MVHADNVERATNLILSSYLPAFSVRDEIIVFTDANNPSTFLEGAGRGYPNVYGDQFFVVNGQVTETTNASREAALDAFIAGLSLPQNTVIIGLSVGQPHYPIGRTDVVLKNSQDLEKILLWWRYFLNGQNFNVPKPLDPHVKLETFW